MIPIIEEISKLTPEELEARKKYCLEDPPTVEDFIYSHERMKQREEDLKEAFKKSDKEFKKWREKLELTNNHVKLPWEEEAQ